MSNLKIKIKSSPKIEEIEETPLPKKKKKVLEDNKEEEEPKPKRAKKAEPQFTDAELQDIQFMCVAHQKQYKKASEKQDGDNNTKLRYDRIAILKEKIKGLLK